ncbi:MULTISPECIES: hypothetical protein [Streptomyces]|nr:hypothetical protein [Streptomyces sp. GF20]
MIQSQAVMMPLPWAVALVLVLVIVVTEGCSLHLKACGDLRLAVR